MADLNLYHVSRPDDYDYDEYSDFVVCAESETAARKTHPHGDDYPGGKTYLNPEETQWMNTRYGTEEHESDYHGWVKPAVLHTLTVKLIGRADPAQPKGVICASFHAG